MKNETQTEKLEVLVIEDDPRNALYAWGTLAHLEELNLTVLNTFHQYDQYIKKTKPDVVITDLCFPIESTTSSEENKLYASQFSKRLKEDLFPNADETWNAFVQLRRNKTPEERIAAFNTLQIPEGLRKVIEYHANRIVRYGEIPREDGRPLEEVSNFSEELNDELNHQYSIARDELASEFGALGAIAHGPGAGEVPPLGYLVVENCKKQKIPYAVITDPSGHGKYVVGMAMERLGVHISDFIQTITRTEKEELARKGLANICTETIRQIKGEEVVPDLMWEFMDKISGPFMNHEDMIKNLVVPSAPIVFTGVHAKQAHHWKLAYEIALKYSQGDKK